MHAVTLSTEQIKKVIMEQSIHIDFFHIIIAGLPRSGKTALLESLFHPPSHPTSVINLYEGIIHRNNQDGVYKWTESAKLLTSAHALLMTLAHFFAKEHQLPNLDSQQEERGPVFDDPEVQKCFETTHKDLCKLLVEFESQDKVNELLTGSLSLVNVFDIGVNKAVYEFVIALGGRNKCLLFLNVLNLNKYDTDSIKKPINLQSPEYRGHYSDSQASMYNDHSALHHFVSRMKAAASRTSEPEAAVSTNTIVVGTHADKIGSDSDLRKKEKEVMDIIKAYGDDMGVPPTAYKSDMVSVNATDERSCERVKKSIIELMELNSSFKINFPVRFVFLHCILYNTKKVLMSRIEVTSYAEKCGIKVMEVDRFLDIFRDCSSIISSSDKEEFLYEYVILRPVKFLQDLDQLFCIASNQAMPANLRASTKFGIVAKELIWSLWPGSYNSSTSVSELYVGVLKSVGLLLGVGDKCFVPSLRLQHDLAPVKSGSLIIQSDVPLTPFSSKQCQFVEYLTTQRKNPLKLSEECPYYNCIAFSWKKAAEKGKEPQKADITIRFFQDYIEVSIKGLGKTTAESLSNLYSSLKTDCVVIMNKIASRKSHLKHDYTFHIPCPLSIGNVKSQHFIAFDILNTNVRELRCPEPKCRCVVSGRAELQWVRAAYQGPPKAAINEYGRWTCNTVTSDKAPLEKALLQRTLFSIALKKGQKSDYPDVKYSYRLS